MNKFISGISEHAEIYISFLITVAVLLLHILHIVEATEKLLLVAILVTLNAIALSIVRYRSDVAKIERLTYAIVRERSRLSADEFLDKADIDAYTRFHEKLAGAQSVLILGVSNLKTVNTYFPQFETAVRNGATIQVLCLYPSKDNPAVFMQYKRAIYPTSMSPDIVISHIHEAAGKLKF